MELTWKQFQLLNHIKDLPLQEQQTRYHFYLEELSNYINIQNKGEKDTTIPPYSGFILQENGDYLLQEDGSRIYL